jgi:hypothetical protein
VPPSRYGRLRLRRRVERPRRMRASRCSSAAPAQCPC